MGDESLDPIERAIRLKRWAVVGASDDPSRASNDVVGLLASRGYEPLPVNPRLASVRGIACAPSVAALDPPPEVVNLVVNPKIGLGMMDEIVATGAKFLWMQPGAEDDRIEERALGAGMTPIRACVLVVLRIRPGFGPAR